MAGQYLDNFGNEENIKLYLDFADEEVHPEEAELRVTRALEEFTFEEIITENDLDEEKVLALLYMMGYVGLPEYLDDTEEVQSSEEES